MCGLYPQNNIRRIFVKDFIVGGVSMAVNLTVDGSIYSDEE